ncbi:hypothetical protein [Polaromonas sp. P5_D5]
MGDLITHDVRALWLRLRATGGWWTLASLHPHWKPTYEPNDIQQAMDMLEAGGFVESRHQTSRLSYSVTPDCQTLPGLEPDQEPATLAVTKWSDWPIRRWVDWQAARNEFIERRMAGAALRRPPHPHRHDIQSTRSQRNHMLLSSTGIKLRVHLRTHDGENVFVELENEDIEKAAMAKASVTEAEVHPIRMMCVEFVQAMTSPLNSGDRLKA